jgi:apolipoprotein N-acyltransferase
VAYDDIIHDSVKNGAEILFVQTNNASFGPTNESTQQLAMSRLRAIETGRPVMQISTVGVSAIYTPTGREVVRSGHFTAEQISATVNLRMSITPAVRLGEWPVLIVSAGTVLLVAAGLIASRRAKTAK